MFKKAKKLLSLVLAVAVCAASIGVAPLSASAQSVEPTDWQKGANLPCWYDKSYDSLDTIKGQGYNAVNLNWNTSLPASTLDKYLTKCEKLGLTPTVSLWDANGKTDYESLQKCSDYWVNDKVAGVMKSHSSAILEVAAGWDAKDVKTWQESYTKVLTKIDQKYQYNCKIAVCAPSCATDAKIFGQALLAIRVKLIHIRIVIIDVSIIAWTDIWGFRHWIIDIRIIVIDIYIVHYYYYYGYPYHFGNIKPLPDKEYIQICKEENIGFYPMIWCGDKSGYELNMTSDWVHYTERGKYLSQLMFG